MHRSKAHPIIKGSLTDEDLKRFVIVAVQSGHAAYSNLVQVGAVNSYYIKYGIHDTAPESCASTPCIGYLVLCIEFWVTVYAWVRVLK